MRSQLVRLLRDTFPKWEVLRHEDLFTAGHPDISISNTKKRTLWLETKFERFKSRKVQRETLIRLNGLYVFYRRYARNNSVKVIEPVFGEVLAEGKGHSTVVDFVSNWFYSEPDPKAKYAV